ncbi:hypothetical protein CDL12_16764 [Handroanthus impetiginosus]|uniref:Aluminum-activated malate transporter n=1 Tax=Handroanthus impetiginosus TaxID=429701 RepID=A0A2G9GZE4_9LAMI|nr:hypothetical protein CDL12_16764 [Handroanthus impetiginosus]
MEMEPRNLEKVSFSVWLKGILSKSLAKTHEIARETTKIAKDDPRRLIHSLKFGLAITLVSLFYYFQPLYNSFGVSAMWAVMTVVVVFEFSVGATLGKGLNRGLATMVAGALGLGAHHLASLTGKTSEPILIGLFVFLQGASACVVVSIFICPVWAGEDLHKLIAKNMKKLGSFLEDDFFRTSENGEQSPVSLSSILVDSKSTEENLANFARWEPGHGQFMYRHPWKQYLKIGNLTRQCACKVEALTGCLNSKTEATQGIRGTIIEEASSRMSSECGKALKELAWAIEKMIRSSSSDPHIANLKIASLNLKSLLKSGFWKEYSNLLQLIQVAGVASLLIDIGDSVENIADAVSELSFLAKFKCKESNGAGAEVENQNNNSFRQVGLMFENPIVSN